jgi:hypothetical protein
LLVAADIMFKRCASLKNAIANCLEFATPGVRDGGSSRQTGLVQLLADGSFARIGGFRIASPLFYQRVLTRDRSAQEARRLDRP